MVSGIVVTPDLLKYPWLAAALSPGHGPRISSAAGEAYACSAKQNDVSVTQAPMTQTVDVKLTSSVRDILLLCVEDSARNNTAIATRLAESLGDCWAWELSFFLQGTLMHGLIESIVALLHHLGAHLHDLREGVDREG